MSTANPEAGAVEVTDVASAAQALEARMSDDFDEPVEVEEEPVTTDEAEAEPEETTDDTESEEEAPDESAESDDLEADASDEAPEFHSVDDLAEALDMPVDEFLQKIKGKVKINGEETEVTLSELTKGYQMESDYRRKTMEHADSKREFDQEVEQKRTELDGRVKEADVLLANLEQTLLAEFNGVDWNALRVENPAEYSAKMTDYQGRYAQVQQFRNQAVSENERLQSENQAKLVETQTAFIQREQEALMSAIPEWNDKEVAGKQKGEMVSFLKDRGFNEGEIEHLVDHRVVLLIRDAMSKTKTTEKADLATKKIKKLPKLVKPGTKKTKQAAQADRQADLKKKLQKSGGHVNDVAAILLDRMK